MLEPRVRLAVLGDVACRRLKLADGFLAEIADLTPRRSPEFFSGQNFVLPISELGELS